MSPCTEIIFIQGVRERVHVNKYAQTVVVATNCFGCVTFLIENIMKKRNINYDITEK